MPYGMFERMRTERSQETAPQTGARKDCDYKIFHKAKLLRAPEGDQERFNII